MGFLGGSSLPSVTGGAGGEAKSGVTGDWSYGGQVSGGGRTTVFNFGGQTNAASGAAGGSSMWMILAAAGAVLAFLFLRK